MATENVQQVPDDSIDAAGVSITTATRTTASPRNGVIYNPTTFATGVPVWFHRLQDGRYMALFRNRWHTATSVANNGPQLYSTHAEDPSPCYLVIDPTTGTAEGPYPWVGLDVLTAAVSRDDYLFPLGSLEGVATVQHWVITRYGGLQLQGSEKVPLGYKLGLWADGFDLRIFGANTDGFLASIKKNWGRIGINSDLANPWKYEGAKGWYTQDYIDLALPMPPGNLPAYGPVSMAKKGDRLYIMVTEHVAGAYSARVYTARPVDKAWRALTANTIYLGSDDTYLGGTAYLQPQLPVTGVGFAYVVSSKVTTGNNQNIVTNWGTLSV